MQSSEHTILVVDDDRDILEFLHDLLEMEGYTVTVTAKANYLERLQKRGMPDLILLDVFLSGRDGREIVASLKNQEDTRRIPVLMFSAHPHAEATARAAGADDFLAKPFDLEQLLAKIRLHLS
jgi:DNA-binding response OmpR family regulator